MRDVALMGARTIEPIVHAGRRVTLTREALKVPAGADGPALAVQRTRRPEGPSRPPLVLVHGFAQNRFTWGVTGRSMAAYLAEAGFDVLNLELRGHGASRAYGSGNARHFDEYVDDLVRVAERCAQPPFVMGHSLGGAVCVGAATRVQLAGLVHLAGIFTFATQNPTIRAAARLSLGFEPMLTATPIRVSTGWAGELLGRLYSVVEIAGYTAPIAGWVPDSIERPLLEERLARGFDWTSVEVWLQMCRWALGEPLSYAEAFREVEVPLLVVAGDHDRLAPPADARACLLGSGSTDRQMVVFDAFHHQVHWGHVDLILGRKAPEEVWPRIATWLSTRS